jgi:hypothetical protein
MRRTSSSEARLVANAVVKLIGVPPAEGMARSKNQLWVGVDAYFKQLVETKPGLRRFWSGYQYAFDDPFRSM